MDISAIKNKIIFLYSKGVSTRDIEKWITRRILPVKARAAFHLDSRADAVLLPTERVDKDAVSFRCRPLARSIIL
jgi:hypothetical protein